jgi:hypothetical protein
MAESIITPSNADALIDVTIDQSISLDGDEMKRIEEDINACEAIDVLRSKCHHCLLTTIKNEDVVQKTCSKTAFLYYILYCYRKKMEKNIIENNLASTRNNILQILRRELVQEEFNEKKFALLLLKSRRGEKLAHLVRIFGTSIFLRPTIPWPRIYKMRKVHFAWFTKELEMVSSPEQDANFEEDHHSGNESENH